MPRCRRPYSDSANGRTSDQQLTAEQIQSLVDQGIKEYFSGAGSQPVGSAFNQHLDSYPQRPCLSVMLPTGIPTYGSQMPEAEQTQSLITLIDQRINEHLGAAGFQQAVIPGYGGQSMSMAPPGAPLMPMQMNSLLRPPAMDPPPTVPGGITPTSNGPLNLGAMYQGNPTVLSSGVFDGCNTNNAASGLRRPTQGSTAATSCLLANEQGYSYLAEHVREAKKLTKESRVRFGSWNLGSSRRKLRDVIDTAARRHVNILCLQQIRWTRRKKKKVEAAGFELWCEGGQTNKMGGILIDKSLKAKIFGVRRKGRSIRVKLIVGDMVLNVISASPPQVGARQYVKQKFWEDLNSLVRGVPRSEKLFIGGDFGTGGEGFQRVHGGFGYSDKNQGGGGILIFVVVNDLMIANTFFQLTPFKRKNPVHL